MQRAKALVHVLVPAHAAGRLRVARAAWGSRRYPRRIVEHRYGASTFKVLIGSPYGERYDADWPALAEIEVDEGTGRLGRVRTPAWSIDDLAAAHGVPDVIFMDVEGFEAEALGGAGQTLAAGSSSSPSRGPRTSVRPRIGPVSAPAREGTIWSRSAGVGSAHISPSPLPGIY